ncbi:carbohydrate sulfotransferase 2-like [Heterodontus francisci]|uniref:carbohydrate sulfotransferase 2-like n=1 Tax=Heterodontus francisci TaxID=7792 RepID=UPI00355C25E8
MAVLSGRRRMVVLLGSLMSITLVVNYFIVFRGCKGFEGSSARGRLPSQGPRQGPRLLVYLMTTWRSGSSFIGELFNQHPDVFYHFEPMWHIWQALYPGDGESLQGAARDMLLGLYRCDLSVLQLYHAQGALTTRDLFYASRNKVVCSQPLCQAYRKDQVEMVKESVCKAACAPQSLEQLQNECRKYTAIVIKGVRIFDLEVLRPLIEELDLKVIHLVRDPRAVANSRFHSRHGLIKENLQVLRRLHDRRKLPAHSRMPRDFNFANGMEVICQGLHRSLSLSREAPYRANYLLLRFEDVLSRPLRTLRLLYQFVGLRASSELEGFLLGLSEHDSKNESNPFMVSARDSALVNVAWRRLLGMETVAKVQRLCADAMGRLGYEMVRNQSQLQDMNDSLLSKPLL